MMTAGDAQGPVNLTKGQLIQNTLKFWIAARLYLYTLSPGFADGESDYFRDRFDLVSTLAKAFDYSPLLPSSSPVPESCCSMSSTR
jgi:hypothetical protein